MNTNDLYLEYARVIQMCKGTDLEDAPWVCAQFEVDGTWFNFEKHPQFDVLTPKNTRFAVAVLEGRPVFVGDRLWLKDGHQFAVEDDLYINPESMSWTPPKRTFTLNGVVLPCPMSRTNECSYLLNIGEYFFSFESPDDAKLVKDEIVNILVRAATEERDK